MRFRVSGAALMAALLMSTGVATAQTTTPAPAASTYPTYEVTGGYQVLHTPDNWFPFGLNVDGAWNANEKLGLVGEIGWSIDGSDFEEPLSGIEVDGTSHAWNLAAGPRWTLSRAGRVWPYVQVLGGWAHLRSSFDAEGLGADFDFDGSSNHFVLQPGVGVNVVAGDGWGWTGSVDYRRYFTDEDETGDSGLNAFRVFVGLRLMLD